MMPFLAKIADRLLEKFPESMEGVAVVLPSKRAVVFLKHYLSQRIDKPIFLPEFYAIEEFAEQLSGLKVLDNMSLQFLLYKAYLQHKDEIINQIIEYMENYDDYLPVIRKQVNTLNKEFFSGDELYRAISDG